MAARPTCLLSRLYFIEWASMEAMLLFVNTDPARSAYIDLQVNSVQAHQVWDFKSFQDLLVFLWQLVVIFQEPKENRLELFQGIPLSRRIPLSCRISFSFSPILILVYVQGSLVCSRQWWSICKSNQSSSMQEAGKMHQESCSGRLGFKWVSHPRQLPFFSHFNGNLSHN